METGEVVGWRESYLTKNSFLGSGLCCSGGFLDRNLKFADNPADKTNY